MNNKSRSWRDFCCILFLHMKDIHKDIIYIILGIVVLYAIWFFTGGPERYQSSKPFLKDGSYNQKPEQYDR